MVCGVCTCWNKVEANQTSVAGSKTPQNFIETHHAVYEYVSKPQVYAQAEKYCEYKFASLLSKTQGVQDLSGNLVQFPIWLKKEKIPELQSLTALVYEHRTDTKYAKLMAKFPSFHEITVCAHIQWGNPSKDFETVFSYAAKNFTNEFQLRGMSDEDGFVRFAGIIHGHHSRYSSVFSNDGQWHHICITWQRRNETMSLYADGEYKTSSRIPASEDILMGGIFIIGQDQDSYGGTFKEKESFSGNITSLNVWAKVLRRDQIQKLSLCNKVEQDIVFGWSTHKLEIEPTLKKMEANSVCSGYSSKCRILQNGGDTNYTSCSAELPFVCNHNKDVYKKFQATKTVSRDQTFANKVNMIANRSVIFENPLTSNITQMSAPEALACLQAIEKGMEIEESSLDSVDVLGIIQFLKEVSDVDMHSNKETLEELSQHFVHVTGELLEQSDSEMWSEVTQVIKGPMEIIQTVEKMACNFVQLLSVEKKEVFIHHKNIEIAVSQVDLGMDRHIFKVHTTERVDEIEVAGEDLKKVIEGHTEVAVVNMWSSLNPFQHLFGDQSYKFLHGDKSISDGGYKHAGTYLGSSVISSTVLAGGKEISTSVQYYLWHNEIRDGINKLGTSPVCVFWDFSLGPENEGGWSTAGCHIKNTFSDATSCFCNHTTNFAVLLQVYDVQRSAEEEWILRTLTFIGCGVSLCALVVTFILFLVVGVPKSERTTVHKNLIFALAAAETLLMFSEMAKSNKVACVTVTACLHLFFMAAFAWMLVEGLLLWSKVVAVNMSEDRRMKFYYITGWGLPVIIVSVTLATSFNKYLADTHCWLNVHSDIIWAFVGPVLFILTVNTFVLFRVVMVTISSARRRAKMLTPNCSLEKQIGIQVWATAKPIIVLLPVLGLTWLCGVLVHISVIWAYIFIFLNAFQGLYIFLIYGIYNSEVRNAIQRMKEKKKALSFTNCSQPTNYLSSPRNTTTDIGKPNITRPKSSLSDVPSKTSGNKGHVVSKHPVNIYSILSTENTVVELTSFKASGC
ncbi:adhesion G-protein coupled receptor D2 [Bufo gargarizans]|uniref:adhesion G-protein coupled receptor D2 n=1 Tax=Bufo gargarizans TaxID=30331 RepID=UPI001CF3729C|nr:adhesion G-protein coupled receptor D2 [Bufo gargarizans]